MFFGMVVGVVLNDRIVNVNEYLNQGDADIVGLSMMCYTEGKEKRTCFGECQPNGRMGKLL